MNLTAKNIHQSAMNGFKRLRNFRAVRRELIKAYVGQYYNQDHGVLGLEPLNMAFTAVRALVPNLVTREPQSIVGSDYLAYREYGNLLAIALDALVKKSKLSKTLQRGLTDAIYTMGIFKIGLMASSTVAFFGEEMVDPGTLYVDTVDFDSFTFDPTTRRMEETAFVGEKIRIERDLALDSGLYDNAILENLPSSAHAILSSDREVKDLSNSPNTRQLIDKLHDFVDVMELWIPDAEALVTLPFGESTGMKFLREEEYIGPDDGPYTYMTLTPPVPDNPIPVQLAGVWHDLHTIGNRIAKKMLDQAEAQKDILGYQGDHADSAQEIGDAKNLAMVRMEDPKAAQMFSVGGQNPANVQATGMILDLFNQFSGNTQMLAGSKVDTNVATVANILHQNQSTGITYMRDQVNLATEDILRKLAWYLHTDELIRMPLIRRDIVPAEYDISETGVKLLSPPQVQETQVFLTPETRRGDFLDFAFTIKQDSMAPINWQFRMQQMQLLAVNVIPAAAAAAQIALQAGTPFSFRIFVTKYAKMMNIDWIDEVFQDSEAIAQMAAVAQQGPQMAASKGVSSLAAVRQNGGSVTGELPQSDMVRQRQEAQGGANQGQSELPIRETA